MSARGVTLTSTEGSRPDMQVSGAPPAVPAPAVFAPAVFAPAVFAPPLFAPPLSAPPLLEPLSTSGAPLLDSADRPPHASANAHNPQAHHRRANRVSNSFWVISNSFAV